MGFSIAHGSPQDIWVPMIYGGTMYMGAIAAIGVPGTLGGNEGVIALPTAAGANDTTSKSIPVGVVIGHNLRRPLYNSTAKAEYITSATCEDSTTEFVSTGGIWPLGGRQHFVKVSLIDPCTIMKGPLYSGSTPGTGPTVLTFASTLSHVAGTVSAATQEEQQYLSTIYFRTGANMGAYRILDTNSTTVFGWDTPLYKDVVVGDTAVVVNMRNIGPCRADVDGTYSTYWNINDDIGTDYYGIFVTRLDLSVADHEFVEFRFDGDHFCGQRA